MIGVDGTIVTIALSSIRSDLHMSETQLVWVVNAYLLTFGSCMLLAGRLGDLYGHRRMFLFGIALFTVASCACGLARTQWFLIGARAGQGVAGAAVWVLSLSLAMRLFTVSRERATALAVFGFVTAAGASVALMLGGVLTSLLNWHWIFLVNVPIGVVVYALTTASMSRDSGDSDAPPLDVVGALALTSSLGVALYTIVNGGVLIRPSGLTLTFLAASALLFGGFLMIEAHARRPLVPLHFLRYRNLLVCAVIESIVTAAVYGWGFVGALRLQQVLRYDPMGVGLSFLPANVLAAGISLGLSSRLAVRFGNKLSLTFGLSVMAVGFAFFATEPVTGRYVVDILPGMVLVGIGLGTAPTPLMLAAMSDVSPGETGLASGIINTASIVGGALGLAILVSEAAAKTAEASTHSSPVVALNIGYHVVFLTTTVLTVAAGVVGAVFLPSRRAHLPPVL